MVFHASHITGGLDRLRTQELIGGRPPSGAGPTVDHIHLSTPVEVIEAIPGQPRAARSSARTFSPHMTRPVSVKP